MIDLLTADSSNFLCRYKSHCFALCHCCEFDACDCERTCPVGCNCYYDSTWQTNIIDCSSNNHTVVPDRIPMDVSRLYLDGNNIDSLKPSNLIARKSLKTLYLNATNLQHIGNRTFNGLSELQALYLNDNMLRTLHGYEFEPLAQLKALYLQSNRLDRINNQSFIYLRSLEVLDLSNNRLSAMNLDLFMFVGQYNIRLRQLSLAHNWWSCQCQSIQTFRQILRQKFLVNGGVNIVDRNQLRCYYNSTTVGPLILDSSPQSVISSGQQAQQSLFGSFMPALVQSASQRQRQQQQQQQQQLTEINQCSELADETRSEMEANPPILYVPVPAPSDQPMPANDALDQVVVKNPYPRESEFEPALPSGPYSAPPIGIYDQPLADPGQRLNPSNSVRAHGPGPEASVPLASFIVVSVLFACIFVVAISVFIFLRQQQQRYHNHHHKKSSAASTTSVSSSASSTALSAGMSQHQHQHQNQLNHHQHSAKFAHHDARHLNLPQPSHFDHTMQQRQHLIMGSNGHQHHQLTSSSQALAQGHRHHHSASSQSNIYATLVPPATETNSATTTTISNINAGKHPQNSVFSQSNNLYSNSTTASHHSSSNSSQHNAPPNYLAGQNTATNWHQQQAAYAGQLHQHQLYGQATAGDSPYAINASVASYKTGTSLYQAADCHQRGLMSSGDWISLPKVKQLMTKIVNKSLALGGYKAASSRDELSNIASDKIYDAFLSYDKRDEAFVMQYLSAELEYGSPQYR